MDNHKAGANIGLVSPSGATGAAFLLATMVFARCLPFYLWAIEDYQRIFCSLVVPIICFFNMKVTKENVLYFALFLMSFVVLGLHREGVVRFFNAALLCFVPMINESFLKKTYRYFNYIFCLILSLSLFNYIFLLLGVPPLGTIKAINALKSYDYGMYPFLVYSLGTSTSIPRFCGVFDEPGVVGTLAGLMLFINRFEMKRWYNIALLLGGFLSFSLFFYVIIAFAPFILSKNTKARVLAVVLLALGLLLVLNTPSLYNLIGYRFQLNSETGSFIGDNRTNLELKSIVSSERFSRAYWWGHEEAEEYLGQSSLLLFGYIHGFLFVLLSLAGYIVMAFKHIWKYNIVDFFVFVIVLFACLYQRPSLYSINYIFIFSALLYSMKDVAILNTNNSSI